MHRIIKYFSQVEATRDELYHMFITYRGQGDMLHTSHRDSLLRSNLIVVKGDIWIVTIIRQIMTKFRRTLDGYQ